MSLIIGLTAAALIGVTLGLVGGGGSILTVPLLVYLFGIQAEKATAYSLFIVGTTSLVGTVLSGSSGMIDRKRAVAFAVPSLIGVYVLRRLIMPGVPPVLYRSAHFALTKDAIILACFGALMLLASFAMIRSRELSPDSPHPKLQRLVLQGLVTGVVTGAVGAGGGFLIVPALVLFARMPMKRAVATSLLIISVNSLVGFAGDLQAGRSVQWNLVLPITLIATLGLILGRYVARFVSGDSLRPAFGVFILITGSGVLASELLRSLAMVNG